MMNFEGDPTTALVVDSLNLGFRWKHKGVFDFAEEYVKTVLSFARSYGCGRIIITADWGSSTYRKELLPEYKGNRKALRENQTEKEEQDFKLFIEEYNRTLGELEMDGYPVLKYKGVEADDIAALIAKNRKTLGIKRIMNLSTDRDWDLMVDEEVSRFSYINRKETTYENWLDNYEFQPEDYITFKCLTGDKGDNIPGVAGVGPKRATALMEQYGTIFDIYDQLPLPGKLKYIENLNATAEQLLLNVELMDLITYCELAIGSDNVNDIMKKLREYMEV